MENNTENKILYIAPVLRELSSRQVYGKEVEQSNFDFGADAYGAEENGVIELED